MPITTRNTTRELDYMWSVTLDMLPNNEPFESVIKRFSKSNVYSKGRGLYIKLDCLFLDCIDWNILEHGNSFLFVLSLKKHSILLRAIKNKGLLKEKPIHIILKSVDEEFLRINTLKSMNGAEVNVYSY